MDAAQGSLEAAKSEVAVAKAKLVHDQALFDYSKITAPFDGVVTQRFANLGALMQAGTSLAQATPLVRLVPGKSLPAGDSGPGNVREIHSDRTIRLK